MNRLLTAISLFTGIFIVFCLAGYIATGIQTLVDSVVAQTATFGVTFVTVLGAALKLYYSLFD